MDPELNAESQTGLVRPAPTLELARSASALLAVPYGKPAHVPALPPPQTWHTAALARTPAKAAGSTDSRPLMELLERGDLLLELSRLLGEAAAGTGRLAFVAGEGGIGKTALVRRFGQMVRDRATVLTGECGPLSTPRPLGPLLDVAPRLPGAGIAPGCLSMTWARSPRWCHNAWGSGARGYHRSERSGSPSGRADGLTIATAAVAKRRPRRENEAFARARSPSACPACRTPAAETRAAPRAPSGGWCSRVHGRLRGWPGS